jgi:hypothetical protein
MITATQCRCATTLLRWSVSKLSRAANAITTDAIRRAFEAVGVVFLRQDEVQLRTDVSPALSR